MKKLLFSIIILAIAAMAAAEPARAGESRVFSDQQEAVIKKAVCKAYAPRKVTVRFVKDENEDGQYFNGSLVDCITDRDSEYLRIFVYASGVVRIIWAGGNNPNLENKVRVGVQSGLNPPASAELKPNIIK